MADFIKDNVNRDGIDRRGFLQRMAWVGIGAIYTVHGWASHVSVRGQAGLTRGRGENWPLFSCLNRRGVMIQSKLKIPIYAFKGWIPGEFWTLSPFIRSFRAWRKRPRARDKLDITVPVEQRGW